MHFNCEQLWWTVDGYPYIGIPHLAKYYNTKQSFDFNMLCKWDKTVVFYAKLDLTIWQIWVNVFLLWQFCRGLIWTMQPISAAVALSNTSFFFLLQPSLSMHFQIVLPVSASRFVLATSACWGPLGPVWSSFCLISSLACTLDRNSVVSAVWFYQDIWCFLQLS